uniref:Coronin-7 n=3 Tax=Parascaris univalens TaxID=6257 RepID=A0A915B957_PARUN
MAWRFHPSKFKNTAPKMPKKEDTIFDVPVGTLSSGNNGIQCSSSLLAFNLDGEGGKLGVLPVDAHGRRQRKDMTVLCAHSEPLNDFAFFPFDPNVLATCCRDEKLKLWRINNPLECASIGNAHAVLDLGIDLYLECLAPHRTASNILATVYDSRIGIVDVVQQAIALEVRVAVDEYINSIGWSYDGRLLAALGDKGRHGAILDPRSGKPIVDSLSVHSGLGRECRVIFAGTEKIVTSGFTNQRTQEIRVFDMRNWQNAECVQEYSPSTGVLIPLYDDDTKLLFLAGKGTNKLIITEIQSRSPIISPVFEYVMHDQFVGASLGSKLRLDVMSGEVVRFYQLAKNCINPVPCIVPRRSYRDFHADLFPETVGPFAGCDAAEWLNGSDLQPMRVSLDPSRKGELIANVKRNNPPEPLELNANVEQKGSPKVTKDSKYQEVLIDEHTSNSNGNAHQLPPEPPKRQTLEAPIITEKPAVEPKSGSPPEPPVRFRSDTDASTKGASRLSRVMSIVGVTSKYRHVETVPGGLHGTFTNVRCVNTRLPTESNGFCISSKYAAIPLAGSAGIVSVVRLGDIRKLPDGVVDGVQNRTPLTDLIWNPFDETRLACALDSGTVNVWTIEDNCTSLAELEPSAVYKVSHDKVISIRYNPCALDVIAVASQDHLLSIWNLENNECGWRTTPHGTDSSLAIAWSSDGRRLASVGKDLTLCIYEPARGDGENALIKRKQVLESPRAARVLFACNDTVIVLVHFTRNSSRVVTLLDSDNLEALHTSTIDTSSQLLVPHYDFDSSVLFLTGKGDRSITMFEVSRSSPFLLPMAPASFPNGHQAICLHHKIVCDVRAVEFQRGWRLTEKSLERLSFRVPRIKKELFQSDLFPRALATWIPAVSASDWFAGRNQPRLFVDLCPQGMQPYISSPVPPVRRTTMPIERPKERLQPPTTIGDCRSEALRKSAREDRKLVEMSWSDRIGVDLTLEQDRVQGVDEEEWIDDC